MTTNKILSENQMDDIIHDERQFDREQDLADARFERERELQNDN